MPPKKIVLKPDIDIVEINQSDLDKSENGDSEQGENENEEVQLRSAGGENENEELHDIQAKKKKPVKGSKLKENSKAIKQSKKKIVEDSRAEIEEEEEDSQAEIEQPKSKKSISKARLNALAAGRKRAHEKREEKKKEAVEALRLQLKKELEAEGYTKKEIKKIENEKVQNEKVQLRSAGGENEKSQPQPQPSDPVNAPKGVNRQSRLRIIEDSTISQHNGHTTYGGFEIPHVGGIIKKIGRKLI
jgi:hypothetical protein